MPLISFALIENRQRLKERMRMIAAFKDRSRRVGVAVALTMGLVLVGLANAQPARTEAPPAQHGASQADTPAPDLEATRQKGIDGRVLDVQGKPVRDASVECLGWDWQASTDAKGRFSWPNAAQPRSFSIAKDGFKTLVTGPLSPGPGVTTLRLQPSPVIGGKVLDKETRQPIPTFQVQPVHLWYGPVTPSLTEGEVVRGFSESFRYSFPDGLSADNALYIDAPGYRPCLSHTLHAADAGKEFLFELVRSQPLAGKVLTPGGTPAEHADVILWCGELDLGSIHAPRKTQSDKVGAFSIPEVLDGLVLVSHESGYVEIPWKEFVTERTIRLAEWGHVKGHWPLPPPGGHLSLERINWSGTPYTSPPPWQAWPAGANPDGSFEFAGPVPAGEYMLIESNTLRIDQPGGGHSKMPLLSTRAHVVVKPGQTTVVDVPPGRPVVGAIDLGDGHNSVNTHLPLVMLRRIQSGPEPPSRELKADNRTPSGEGTKLFRDGSVDFWLSEAGMARRRGERAFQVQAAANGSFRIENVTPGSYELQAELPCYPGETSRAMYRQIMIPDGPNGSAIDLGLLNPARSSWPSLPPPPPPPPTHAKLVGLVNVLGERRALVELDWPGKRNAQPIWLAEGEREEPCHTEVVNINPAERGATVILGETNRLTLRFRHPGEALRSGLVLEDAPVGAVLDLYGKLARRTVLASGGLPDVRLTLTTVAGTLEEAASAIEKALSEKDIVSVRDGGKFLLVLNKSEASSITPRSAELKSTAAPGSAEAATDGHMDLADAPPDVVLDLYALLIGRKSERLAFPVATAPIHLISQSPLTAKEGAYALEMLLRLRGMRVELVGQDAVRVVPMERQ